MRKFILAAALVAAALTTAVPSAFAETPNPPHRAVDADWTGIDAFAYNGSLWQSEHCGANASACDFEDTASYKQVTEAFGSIGTQSCNVTISGQINGTGDLIDQESTQDCYDGLSESEVSTICRHAVTGEYWVRLSHVQPWASEEHVSFARVLTDPSGIGTPDPTVFLRGVRLGDPATNGLADAFFTVVSPSYLAGFWNRYQSANWDGMWSASDVLAGPSQEDADCGWPELS